MDWTDQPLPMTFPMSSERSVPLAGPTGLSHSALSIESDSANGSERVR